MLRLETLIHILEQIINWRTNLDFPKSTRFRKDVDDRGTIQTLQYWLKSYYNGKELRYGEMK